MIRSRRIRRLSNTSTLHKTVRDGVAGHGDFKTEYDFNLNKIMMQIRTAGP
jgi:hypothetical protein